jgi:monoamine oxidase
MKQPFWQNQSGWINFVTKSQYNRYPIAFIYPNAQNKPIILVFVAGKAGREVGEWTDQQVGQDFQQFLTQFIDPSLAEIEEVKMSRWHKDENSLGSYCFNRIGTKKEHFLQLRKPL